MEKTRNKLKKIYALAMILTIAAIMFFLMVIWFDINKALWLFQFLVVAGAILLMMAIGLWGYLAYMAYRSNQQLNTKEFNHYLRPILIIIVITVIKLLFQMFK